MRWMSVTATVILGLCFLLNGTLVWAFAGRDGDINWTLPVLLTVVPLAGAILAAWLPFQLRRNARPKAALAAASILFFLALCGLIVEANLFRSS